MAIDTQDPIAQLQSLRRNLLNAPLHEPGFQVAQAVIRRAVVSKVITNETSQVLLEICQPMHLGTAYDPSTSKQMVSDIEDLIKAEIADRRKMYVG